MSFKFHLRNSICTVNTEYSGLNMGEAEVLSRGAGVLSGGVGGAKVLRGAGGGIGVHLLYLVSKGGQPACTCW